MDLMEQIPNPEQYLPKPFIQTIVLNDGTTLKGSGGYNQTENTLWVWFDDETTIIEAVTIFSDPSKTSHIVLNLSAMDTKEYYGYTRVITVTENYIGKVSVQLKPE